MQHVILFFGVEYERYSIIPFHCLILKETSLPQRSCNFPNDVADMQQKSFNH